MILHTNHAIWKTTTFVLFFHQVLQRYLLVKIITFGDLLEYTLKLRNSLFLTLITFQTFETRVVI